MSGQPSPLAQPEPWDLVASGYAAEAPLVMLPFAARAIELARVPDGGAVVDVAAGSGSLALQVARRVARVSAIDFSEAMLDELRRAAAALGLGNLDIRFGDGQDLPWPTDSFDAGFSLFGLMFFPDRARGFRELHRVLRPGGAAVVSSWAPAAESSLMRAIFGAIRAMDPSWREPEKNLLSLEDTGRFKLEMREAGFVDVEIVPHVHTFPVEDASSLWRALTRSNAPLVMLRKRMGEPAWAERSAAAVAFLEGAVGRELSTKALLGRGVKR
jgi:ubiquinone/menaquinone biosynthesis C-methylase UbiE